jgi:hypothetical protein
LDPSWTPAGSIGPQFPRGLVGQNPGPVVEPCSLERLPYNQVAVSAAVWKTADWSWIIFEAYSFELRI